MPHTTNAQINNINKLVLVKRCQVGDGGQCFTGHNFKRECGEYEGECAADAALSVFDVDDEKSERKNGDQQVEQVDVGDVVAGFAAAETRGHKFRLGWLAFDELRLGAGLTV